VSNVLNSRQKKGPAQLSKFLNVVLTVWHTFCEGNEECVVWLDKLLAEELDTYVVEETNITRELEKSTREWATLYMFQMRSNYANPDTRAVALANMFRERTATTDRTWREQGLTVVSVSNRATASDNSGQSRSTRTQPALTHSTASSQRDANTPVLNATSQARLVALLSALRAQLNTATLYAQQTETAAVAAANDARAERNPPPPSHHPRLPYLLHQHVWRTP
jgi:hypothetical protein